MQTRPNSFRPSAAATMALGAVMGAGIWLAGNPDLAFIGFVAAAAMREAGATSRCMPPRRRRVGG